LSLVGICPQMNDLKPFTIGTANCLNRKNETQTHPFPRAFLIQLAGGPAR
jgi:hypothetical protein